MGKLYLHLKFIVNLKLFLKKKVLKELIEVSLTKNNKTKQNKKEKVNGSKFKKNIFVKISVVLLKS